MHHIENDSVYFEIYNLVDYYLNLKKEDIINTLEYDLDYIRKNCLAKKYYEAENFLLNLCWFLHSDGTNKPAFLLENIYYPMELDFMKVYKKIYEVYKS